MRRVWMILTMMIMLAAVGCAEVKTYTYGGSGVDELREMARSEDGRLLMTGYTESIDGTLSGRTKSGRSGWALCVNTDSEVLWSFCSRNGRHAWMGCPVFHEDGSATVLLFTSYTEIEVIRLSSQGEVMGRKMIYRTQKEGCFGYASVTPLGYLITEQGENWAKSSTLYSFDGEKLRVYGNMGAELSDVLKDTQFIKVHADGDRILRQRPDGEYERYFEIPQSLELREYPAIKPAKDGGVILLSYADTQEKRMGRVIRLSAQGELVYDMRLPAGEAIEGFDAEHGTYVHSLKDGCDSVLSVLDGDGIVKSSRTLLSREGFNGCFRNALTVLEDGRAALLGLTSRDARVAEPVLAIVDM